MRRTFHIELEVVVDDAHADNSYTAIDLADDIRHAVFNAVRTESELDPIVMMLTVGHHHEP